MAFRVCHWNIQDLDELFDSQNRLVTTAPAQERLGQLAAVLTAIAPDFLGVVEAPNDASSGNKSTVKCLEAFAAFAGLSARKGILGYPSRGQQEIAALYDPDRFRVRHAPGGRAESKSNPKFDGQLHFDTDDDRIVELYEFYRPPLELRVQEKATGDVYWFILAHAKSKGIFDAMDQIHWRLESERNRRKLFAECTWIRRRVEEWLKKGRRVVVMGDMNDGPGMDEYEFQFGRSAVELIMGDLFDPGRVLLNLAGRPRWSDYGWTPATTRFRHKFTGDFIRVMIDHVLISQDVPVTTAHPHQIWNPFENDLARPLKDDLLPSSDHFPVSLDVG